MLIAAESVQASFESISIQQNSMPSQARHVWQFVQKPAPMYVGLTFFRQGQSINNQEAKDLLSNYPKARNLFSVHMT